MSRNSTLQSLYISDQLGPNQHVDLSRSSKIKDATIIQILDRRKKVEAFYNTLEAQLYIYILKAQLIWVVLCNRLFLTWRFQCRYYFCVIFPTHSIITLPVLLFLSLSLTKRTKFFDHQFIKIEEIFDYFSNLRCHLVRSLP